MLRGIRALSPAYLDHIANAIIVAPEPQKSPIMVGEAHAKSAPPQLMARSSSMIAGAKRRKPTGSTLRGSSESAWRKGSFGVCSGMRTAMMMMTVRAPRGRKIQKPDNVLGSCLVVCDVKGTTYTTSSQGDRSGRQRSGAR